MTFLDLQKRLRFLIGEDGSTGADNTTTGLAQKSHINAAIQDIINKQNFSWNVAVGTLTLSGGTANLPTDFNPKWGGLVDARIENNVFTYVTIPDRELLDNTYWITYDTINHLYVFNTPTQEGSVNIYYYYTPSDLSLDADVCIVPDGEAVAYLAASKHWISDERNSELSERFAQEADKRIMAMYIHDLNFGPVVSEGNIVELNPSLRGGNLTGKTSDGKVFL